MNEKNIFELAVKGKYRFNFKGSLLVEDLFDLNVTSLDSIFKELNSQLKQTNEESLLDVRTKEDKELETKIEIVKFIVREKLEEQQARATERENKEKKQKLMTLLEKKREEKDQALSEEEILKQIQELG